jgi:alpha-1,3-rhamnosyl/mannosyltransferase
MTQAMVRLLDDEVLRGELAARGLRRAATYSWARTAAETAAVYQDVLSAREARS